LGLYQARQYDRALRLFSDHLESASADGTAHFWLSEVYAQKGMNREAIEHLRTSVALFGLKDIADSMDRGYATSGYFGAMRELVKGTEELYAHRQFTPQWIARFYARMGDEERALKWLQEDSKERADEWLVYLNVDPIWDPLRSDPRFQNLVRHVGLPQSDAVIANSQ